MTRVAARKQTPKQEEKQKESLMASISESKATLAIIDKEIEEKTELNAELEVKNKKLNSDTIESIKASKEESDNVVVLERVLREINVDIVAAGTKLEEQEELIEQRRVLHLAELTQMEKEVVKAEGEIEDRIEKLRGQEKTERQAYGALLIESDRVSGSIAKKKEELAGVISGVGEYKIVLDELLSNIEEVKDAKETIALDISDLKSDIKKINAGKGKAVSAKGKSEKELEDVKAELVDAKKELARLSELNVSILKREERLNRLIPEIKELYRKAGVSINLS